MCDEDEILLRYHFGDLSASEVVEFERRLQDEPALAARLDQLRECIALKGSACSPCGGKSEEVPPAALPRKLADRTAKAVLAVREIDPPCGGAKRFCLAECAVAGVAVAFIAMIVFPGLLVGRETMRRNVCSLGMYNLSQSLSHYRIEHASRYPEIGFNDYAGLFTVALAETDFTDRESLQQSLLCPASELAEQVAARRAVVFVPTRVEIHSAPGLLLDRIRRFMAGSYAYRIGYLNGADYVYPDSNLCCRTPLMSDAPSRGCGGLVVSRNHGECGQNVLYEDGHVAFLTGCWSPGTTDHLFLNDVGDVAAGRRSRDIVLAPSEATPGVVRFVPFGL